MDKKLLRKILLEKRGQITERAEKNDAIAKKIVRIINEKNFKKIFSYVSMGGEVDTINILSYYKTGSVKIYVPYTQSKMRLVELLPWDILEADRAGNIPGAKDKPFYEGEVDIALVPLLGFDTKNNRLGYGGGFYDRYFAKHNNLLKAGLAFDEQETDGLEPEDFDVALDIVITPTRTINIKRER